MEVWKDISGYEGYYQVSTYGRVRGIDRIIKLTRSKMQLRKSKILSQHKTRDQYVLAWLSKDSSSKGFSVHRLVAIAFLPNPNNLKEVNHKDLNKANNHVSNLEWIDKAGNMNHAKANGAYANRVHGEKNQTSKLSNAAVIHIKRKEMSARQYAKLYSVSRGLISHIWTNRSRTQL